MKKTLRSLMVALIAMFAMSASAQDYATVSSVNPAVGEIKLDDNEYGLTSITIYMDGEWDASVYAGDGNPVPAGVSLVGPEGAITINDSYGFCMWQGSNQINVNHTPYALTTPGEYTLTIPAGLNTIGGKSNPEISYTWTVVAKTTFEFSSWGATEAIGEAGASQWEPMRSLEGFKLAIPEDIELVSVPSSLTLNIAVGGYDAEAAPVECALAQADGKLVFTFPAAYSEKASVRVEIPAGAFTSTTGLTSKAFNTSFSVDPTKYFSFEVAGDKEITGPITGFDLTLSEDVVVSAVGESFKVSYWQDGNHEGAVAVTGYTQNGQTVSITFADAEFPHDVYVSVAFEEGFLTTADGAISHSVNSWNHYVTTPAGGGDDDAEGVVFDFGADCYINDVAVNGAAEWNIGDALVKNGVSITSDMKLTIANWGVNYIDLPYLASFTVAAPEGSTITKVALENAFSDISFEGFTKDEAASNGSLCVLYKDYENENEVTFTSKASAYLTKIIVYLAKEEVKGDANFDFTVLDQTHTPYSDNGVTCEFGAHWVGYGADLYNGESITFTSEEKKIAKVELDITSMKGNFVIRQGEGTISVADNVATWTGSTNVLEIASDDDIAFSAARIWFATEEEPNENEQTYADWKKLVTEDMKAVYDAYETWPTEDVVGEKPAKVVYAVCNYYQSTSWLFGPMGFGDDWAAAAAYYANDGSTLAEEYAEALAIWNAYENAELVSEPEEVTLVDEGVATGYYCDWYGNEIGLEDVPVAYEKYSDGSIVLKNFWNTGKDLPLTFGEAYVYEGYTYADVETVVDVEGLGYYYPYGNYNYYMFENPIEYNGETCSYFMLSTYTYYMPETDELTITYMSGNMDEYELFNVAFGYPYEDPSGINTVIAADSNKVYDLAGRRVVKAQKGLNIVNGKVILK